MTAGRRNMPAEDDVDDDLLAIHRRVQARKAFNKARAEELAQGVNAGALFRSVGDPLQTFVLSRRIASDTGSSKPWRVSRFDQLGPVGHVYADTVVEAIFNTLHWYGDLTLEERANPPHVAVFPMTDGLHTVQVGPATVVYRVTDGVADLASLRSPARARGQGHATAAMAAWLEAVDAAGLPAKLLASPLDAKTKLGRLVAFYQRFGFQVAGKGNLAGHPIMVRAARTNPPAWALSLEPTVGPVLVAERNPAAKEWKKPPVCKPKGKVKAKPGDRVRVHRNLHNGCWVVSKGGKVAGYATSLTLKDARPRVGAAGYGRCMAEQRRNVHAYIDGTLVSLRASSPQGWKRITYNCRTGPAGFYYVGAKSKLFEGAAEVRFIQRGTRASVYVRGKLGRENPPACACTTPGGLCSCGSVDAQAVQEDGPSCNDPGGVQGTVAVRAGPGCALLDLEALVRIAPERWWQDSCPSVLAYRGPSGSAARRGWEHRLDDLSPSANNAEALVWVGALMGCGPAEVEAHLFRNGEGWVEHVNGGRS